ncbi:MAG: trehalase-like domain-containing protein [Nitrospiraceae bacterium]
MPYSPIEDYGLIGNLRTAALVNKSGGIDWLCLPAFDSPSVFAAILDDQTGGRFDIKPETEHLRTKQFYWPDANVLVTRFLSHGRDRRNRRLHAGGACRRFTLVQPPDSTSEGDQGRASLRTSLSACL